MTAVLESIVGAPLASLLEAYLPALQRACVYTTCPN
jgi:hypothetical protein